MKHESAIGQQTAPREDSSHTIPRVVRYLEKTAQHGRIGILLPELSFAPVQHRGAVGQDVANLHQQREAISLLQEGVGTGARTTYTHHDRESVVVAHLHDSCSIEVEQKQCARKKIRPSSISMDMNIVTCLPVTHRLPEVGSRVDKRVYTRIRSFRKRLTRSIPLYVPIDKPGMVVRVSRRFEDVIGCEIVGEKQKIDIGSRMKN